MSRPTARRAVARRAASRRDAAGRGARHREPGRPGAGCRTTDPGKPGSLPAEPRQSPGRPNQVQSQVQSQVRPAAGQWRGGPPGRRLPARSPGLRLVGQSPAAGSRGLWTRAVRNRGSRGRSTRERRPRMAGSRIRTSRRSQFVRLAEARSGQDISSRTAPPAVRPDLRADRSSEWGPALMPSTCILKRSEPLLIYRVTPLSVVQQVNDLAHRANRDICYLLGWYEASGPRLKTQLLLTTHSATWWQVAPRGRGCWRKLPSGP